MKKPQTYLYSADLIRAIAIVFVVVVHVCSEYLGKGLTIGTGGWWFANILETFAKVAVPLFIILSGSLLLDPQKNYSVKEFYKRRYSTIGIPLLFWPFFYYFALHIISHNAITFGELLNDYIFLNMFYHLYFLYIIAGLYLIAPFLQKMLSLLNDTEEKILIFGTLLFSLLITPLVYFTQTKINYWSIFTVSLPFIGYFLAGNYLRNEKISSKKQAVRSAVFFLSITALVTTLKYMAYRTNSRDVLRYLDDVLNPAVICMSLTGYVLIKSISSISTLLVGGYSRRIVKQLAKASLAIYLVHPVFIFLYKRFMLHPATWIGLELLIEFVFVLSCSYIIFLALDKNYFTRRLIGR